MSDIKCDVTDDVASEEGKIHKRRKERRREDKKPIRLVSSLGEGKLVDKFKNAMGEKENRKKSREKMEKDRKQSKEKREREIARFQAEIDALLEDGPVEAPKNKTKTYVPKLSGTVKGKFEALEKKKQEEEKLKTETERKKRNERDSREKKRMQIELAKKKLKMKEEGKSFDEEEEDAKIIKSKSPGKINIDFQEEEKRRKERKSRKLEMEKMLRMKEEIRSMKQPVKYEESSDEEYPVQNSPTPAPKKLTTDFNKLLKEQENKQRSQIEEEKRRKLEEEKLAFRAARLAAGETDGVSSSSLQSQSSSPEVIRKKPNRLASSFTKFDVLEAQRFEEERKRIQEKRNALLEEEKKMFEKTKAMMQECSEEEDDKAEIVTPGRLNASFTNFDIFNQKKLEEERIRLQEEKRKLLEEETFNFKNHQNLMERESSSESSCPENEESEEKEGNGNERKKKKKNNKLARVPSKLDYSKRKFDVLERQRMEEERLRIQEQRNKLLEEEARFFEEAKQHYEENSDSEDCSQKTRIETSPGKLDGGRTNFDRINRERLEEERLRIMKERNRLLEEEKKLMDLEREKIKEQDLDQDGKNKESTNRITRRLPSRLNKSFTEFDKVERMRIKEERDSLFQEKARKLEEERRLFKEARKQMKDDSDSSDEVNSSLPCQPNKLPSTLTNFNVIEGQRLENERIQLHEERIKQLENEIKIFEDQRKQNPDSVDDVTSATKELLQSAKNSPRPKKLASSFTKFDVVEKKRREEERRKLQEERARKLAEERRMFKESREQLNNQSDSEKEDSISCDAPIVGKMDIRGKIEAVVRAQEEAERKRIEETKFSRMTGEQQEMYLARQRQIEMLQQQLASAKAGGYSEDSEEEESDDECYYYYTDEEAEDSEEDDEGNDGSDAEENSAASESGCSNDSGEYSGYPYFVQTLSNLKVKEGDPVRFDAYINANPHPKVVWYFKGRVIRNCPDYQYMNKGTQYSLYMNESFVDDTGEFACKATNDKGTATSKACLFVNEIEEE
ncbi:uncharacterized protein LOC100185110 [Ciona intestinalis]